MRTGGAFAVRTLPSEPTPHSALRLARLSLGFTLLDATLGTGIDQGRLSRIERGRDKPSPQELERLNRFLASAAAKLQKSSSPAA